MGEMIKPIGELSLGGESFRIELNHSTSRRGEKEIHIQNDAFRFTLSEEEFLQICAGVLLAKKQLEQIKGAEAFKALREGE